MKILSLLDQATRIRKLDNRSSRFVMFSSLQCVLPERRYILFRSALAPVIWCRDLVSGTVAVVIGMITMITVDDGVSMYP